MTRDLEEDIARFTRADVTTQMPTSGNATYSGNMGFARTPMLGSTEAIGRLTLTADFATGRLTGAVTDFASPSQEMIGGTIALSNGVIVGSQMTADAVGTNPLAPNGAALVGSMQGEFFGANAGALAGTMVGSAGTENVFGRFATD